MLIALDNVTKFFDKIPILEELSAQINPGDRIGLIGPNGAGKTTLLGMIVDEIDYDLGQISRLPNLRIGYFHQNSEQELERTVADCLYAPFRDTLRIKAQIDDVVLKMADTDPDSDLGRELSQRYDKLNTAFEAADGYHIDVKIDTVVEGMDFRRFPRDLPTDKLSGGERTRLGLIKLLLIEPDLLILDEVTNHLDFKMLAFLEDYLGRYKGAVLTVSHDRYYLNHATNKTWEIENKRLITYPAAYDGYLPLKEQRDARIEKEYQRYIAEKARLEDYVQRNITRATTANMAKSRLKMIEHLDQKPPPAPQPKPPKIRFKTKGDPIRTVLEVQGLALSVGEGAHRKQLFTGLDFAVTRGERLAVIGPNGVGKSTLFKALGENYRPDSGSIDWGRGAQVSYFVQDDAALSGYGSVLDYLRERFVSQDTQELRSTLGAVGIRGKEVFKPVAVLSGGEKAKVKIAVMLLQQGNVLLMDEPTNHLDIPAKEQLEQAMRNFEGTIVAISHDRHFLSTIPTRILELTPDGGRLYAGNFEDYQRAKEAEAAAMPEELPKPLPKNTSYHRTKKQRSAQLSLRNKIAGCEADISATEARVAEIQELIADEATASDYERLLALTEELHTLEQKTLELMEQWEALHADLDSI